MMQVLATSMTMFVFGIHLMAFVPFAAGLKIAEVNENVDLGPSMAVDSSVSLESPSSLLQQESSDNQNSSDKPYDTIEATKSEPKLTSMMGIYACSMLGLAITNAVIYWHRGPVVWLRLVMYLISLSTITLAVKHIYVNYDFRNPKFLSCTHFVMSGGLCYCIMLYRQKHMDKPIPVPTLRQFVRVILPVTFTFATAIAAGNMALVYSSAGFVEMIASTGPVCVVLISIALGIHFHKVKFMPVMVVTLGMVLCIHGEVKFSMAGTLFAGYAAFSSSLKSALQNKVLCQPEEGETALDPIELLAWMSPCSVALMLVWSSVTEGAEPWIAVTSGDQRGPLIASILLSCFNACVLNVSNLFVIKDLGAVGAVLVANLKSILLMLGSIAVFNDTISTMQVVGFVLELIGVYIYNSIDKNQEAKEVKSIKDIESTPLVKKK